MRIINYKDILFLLFAIFGLTVVAEAQQKPGIYQKQKIERDSKVSIRNDFGSVTITGWERETIQAVARDVSSAETSPVSIREDSSNPKRIVIAVELAGRRSSKDKINLEVKIPRYAELAPVYISSNNIAISDLDGTVNVKTDSGGITVRRVGSANTQTKNGEITAENVEGDFTAKSENGNVKLADIEGLVEVTTGNGNVEMLGVEGDVKVVAINSKILAQCVQGDVEISDTSSQIMLLGIGGNVDVSTSNGKANFIGTIKRANRYRLKTLSGAVSMAIPNDVGFTALLSSYSGQIETDFKFQNDSQISSKTNRRGTIRFGDGEARIELDSFDGRIRLGKIASEAIQKCSGVKTND